MRGSLAVLVVFLVACGDDNGPNAADVQGTWSGFHTNSAFPGLVSDAVIELSQEGTAITGTFTTSGGRSADVEGAVDEEQMTATFTYTDNCEGTAETTADILEDGTRLVGTYTSNDCAGATTGTYDLTKEGE